MLVVDTNVLLYAADRDSEFNGACRSYLEAMRARATPTYLSWNVCYEFIRVSSHSRVFRTSWTSSEAWSFLQALLQGPGFGVLISAAMSSVNLTKWRPQPWVMSSLHWRNLVPSRQEPVNPCESPWASGASQSIIMT